MMSRIAQAFVLVVWVGAQASVLWAQEADELSLRMVLESVHRYHPKYASSRAQVRQARARAFYAHGAFDAQIGLRGELHPLGDKKAYSLLALTWMQPTMFWGMSVFAGWNASTGDVPMYKDTFAHKIDPKHTGYKGDPEAAPPGVVHAGIFLPLWQDGPVDKRRTKIAVALAKVRSARFMLDATLLALELEAAKAYISWVAQGMKVLVAKDLLRQAVARQSQIQRKAEAGSEAALKVVENEQYVLKRRGKMLLQEQKLAKSSAKLSLYWRSVKAPYAPLMPELSRLPKAFKTPKIPSVDVLERELKEAHMRLPSWHDLKAKQDVLQSERRMAHNQLAPRVDLTASAAQHTQKLSTPDLSIGVSVQAPVGRRQAFARLDKVDAKLVQLAAKQRWLMEKTRVLVRQAFVELNAAYEQVRLVRRELELAKQMEKAEHRRFKLGATSLLVLNVREQARADAAMRVIDAEYVLQIAFAKFRIATGRSLRGG